MLMEVLTAALPLAIPANPYSCGDCSDGLFSKQLTVCLVFDHSSMIIEAANGSVLSSIVFFSTVSKCLSDMSSVSTTVNLHHLLSLACPDPLDVLGEDPAAYLALAVHCLLVNAGFVADAQRHRHSAQPRYPPPPTWQGQAAQEWGVTYIKPGCCNRFQLRVASQHATSKLLVHVTELGNKENIQLLGLYVPNYAPGKPPHHARWPGT